MIKDGLLSIPPGFERGLEGKLVYIFNSTILFIENAVEKNQIEGKLNLNDIFSDIDDDILKLLGGEDKEDNVVEEDVLQEKVHFTPFQMVFSLFLKIDRTRCFC